VSSGGGASVDAQSSAGAAMQTNAQIEIDRVIVTDAAQAPASRRLPPVRFCFEAQRPPRTKLVLAVRDDFVDAREIIAAKMLMDIHRKTVPRRNLMYDA